MAADVAATAPPVETGTDTDTAKIGQRLKAIRRAQRKTLEEVAEASGLTKGFLSKIERDLASASVAALLRICGTLGIPLSTLFDNDSTGEVIRRGHYPHIDFGGQGLAEYLLTPAAERRIQVILSEVAPGGGSGNEGYSLPAEVEFVYVVGGELELGFAEDTVRLGAGDAFTFDPARLHTFRAASVESPTTVMWVICPALSSGERGSAATQPATSRAGYAAGLTG